jgi:predicted nucleotidyltransferase
MTILNGSIEEEIHKIEKVLHKHREVRVAVLFGSMATGKASQSSDLDLALQLETRMGSDFKLALIEELAKVTGRSVDLIDLLSAGEPLLGQILKTG